MRALQLSNTAGHSIPPKQPMNVVVAPTANQLIAMLAANLSTRTWNLVTAICAFLIVAEPVRELLVQLAHPAPYRVSHRPERLMAHGAFSWLGLCGNLLLFQLHTPVV